MKDEHANDVAQDVAQDAVQDVAQDVTQRVLGAAEVLSANVLIAARAISRRRNPHATHACRPPRCPWAKHEGRSAGCGGWLCRGRATGRNAGLGLRGPGSARPPRHALTTAAAVFSQLALRWGRNWAAQ